VSVGNNVTLRSLLPSVTVTLRLSGLHPELGIITVTSWSPTETDDDIGVVFPEFTPSIQTWAPEGNDVTFRDAFCAKATPAGIRKKTNMQRSRRIPTSSLHSTTRSCHRVADKHRPPKATQPSVRLVRLAGE
jgi:hypothetical protein